MKNTELFEGMDAAGVSRRLRDCVVYVPAVGFAGVIQEVPDTTRLVTTSGEYRIDDCILFPRPGYINTESGPAAVSRLPVRDMTQGYSTRTVRVVSLTMTKTMTKTIQFTSSIFKKLCTNEYPDGKKSLLKCLKEPVFPGVALSKEVALVRKGTELQLHWNYINLGIIRRAGDEFFLDTTVPDSTALAMEDVCKLLR